jgi:hypothetical protein
MNSPTSESNPAVSLLGGLPDIEPVPPSEDIVITEPTIQMRVKGTAPEDQPVATVDGPQHVTIR